MRGAVIQPEQQPYCFQKQVGEILQAAVGVSRQQLSQAVLQGQLEVWSLCAGVDVTHIVCNALLDATRYFLCQLILYTGTII